ncbi:MAG: helicase-related protein, partial [Campylobacterota bacterium]
GTAEVIKTIQESSDLTPQQFDTDTITTATKLKKALSAFEKGETNVLVGTQMLSKGHDYPNVTLAIIMGLDFLLARADFRAREKAMALFLQIAGRSGRNKDARILVQSDNEQFFQSYLHDYEAFLQDEKAFRQGLYPPYTTLARLLFAHGKDEVCKQRMEKVLQKLQENNCAEIVGAGPNAIEKIAGRYRYHILLRTTTKAAMQKCIAGVYEGSFEVDMDCIFFD